MADFSDQSVSLPARVVVSSRAGAFLGLANVVRAFQSLRPALLNVTREASQLAEQGDVADLQRLELRLRLAEVEGLLSFFEQG